MAKGERDAILGEYDKKVDLYNAFARKMKDLVEEVLRDAGVREHSVTYRVKDRESLRKKLRKPGGRYSDLTDVTDIAGIRVTTYFADDVDRIAERIERELAIDWENSTDRRQVLDPDRFGYLSFHHVVGFSRDRERLFEYKQYAGLKAEIQTRSILQHAWAEIEHDLGYKTPESIPRSTRRKFSRLAGLLELADEEFQNLRDDLQRYERNVPQQIEEDPQEVEINKTSLVVFLHKNGLVKEIDKEVAHAVPQSSVGYVNSGLLEPAVKGLKSLRVTTIQQLEMKLREQRSAIPSLAYEWLVECSQEAEKPRGYVFITGVSIFYLVHILAAQTHDVEAVVGALDSWWDVPPGTDSRRAARRLLNVYDSIRDRHP